MSSLPPFPPCLISPGFDPFDSSKSDASRHKLASHVMIYAKTDTEFIGKAHRAHCMVRKKELGG